MTHPSTTLLPHNHSTSGVIPLAVFASQCSTYTLSLSKTGAVLPPPSLAHPMYKIVAIALSPRSITPHWINKRLSIYSASLRSFLRSFRPFLPGQFIPYTWLALFLFHISCDHLPLRPARLNKRQMLYSDLSLTISSLFFVSLLRPSPVETCTAQ